MRVLDDEQEESLEVNIVPMIDVVFAILAFFIVSTLLLTRTEGLPVNLPKADTAEASKPADFTVTIDEKGRVFLNQEELAVDELSAEIQSQLDPGQQALITLQADDRINHGRVIEVMDSLRTIEGASMGIATRPKSPGKP